MQMESTKYFIDDQQTNHLFVEYEWSEDWSAGSGDTTVVDVRGVSLNGIMSLKMESIPADWMREINEQIKKQIWEQVQQAA